MPKRPCLRCGALTDGSYCPQHRPQPWTRRSPSSRATARPGWNALHNRALQRDGRQCTTCGARHNLAGHHITPVADGGTNTLDNLVTLCESCHATAHRLGAA